MHPTVPWCCQVRPTARACCAAFAVLLGLTCTSPCPPGVHPSLRLSPAGLHPVSRPRGGELPWPLSLPCCPSQPALTALVLTTLGCDRSAHTQRHPPRMEVATPWQPMANLSSNRSLQTRPPCVFAPSHRPGLTGGHQYLHRTTCSSSSDVRETRVASGWPYSCATEPVVLGCRSAGRGVGCRAQALPAFSSSSTGLVTVAIPLL